ncbi:MAG: ABC transporter substrate-binding protein [Elusimicrobiota bacterium]
MRRIRIILLSFLLAFAAGCGKNSAGKLQLTWAVGKDATGAQKKLIKLFMERHPKYLINMIEMPESANSQRDSYVTYLTAHDSSIDIYSLDIIWPAEFAAAGWLLPLGGKLTYPDRNDFLKGPLDGCTYKKELYAVPWFTDAGVLYYRKDLLENEKLTYPKTWEELEKQALLIGNKYKINGFVFQAEQYEGLVCNFLEYLWSFGGDVMDKNGKPSLDSPAGRGALGFMYDMIHINRIVPEGTLAYKEEESRQVFTSGKAVFLRNWPYVWALAQDKTKSKVAGLVGIAPLPGNPPFKGASALGGWNLGISKFSKNPGAAWEFITFMTSAEAQKVYAIEGGRLPTRKSVYKDKDVLAFAPHYGDFYDVFVNAKPRPASPVYSQMSDIIQIEVHQALTKQKNIAEALKSIDSKLAGLSGKGM